MKVTIAILDRFGETLYAVGETKQKAKNAIIDLWEDKYVAWLNRNPDISEYRAIRDDIQYIEIGMNQAKVYGYE